MLIKKQHTKLEQYMKRLEQLREVIKAEKMDHKMVADLEVERSVEI